MFSRKFNFLLLSLLVRCKYRFDLRVHGMLEYPIDRSSHLKGNHQSCCLTQSELSVIIITCMNSMNVGPVVVLNDVNHHLSLIIVGRNDSHKRAEPSFIGQIFRRRGISDLWNGEELKEVLNLQSYRTRSRAGDSNQRCIFMNSRLQSFRALLVGVQRFLSVIWCDRLSNELDSLL